MWIIKTARWQSFSGCEGARCMDIRSIARLKQAWNRFSMNHPKFPEFLRAVKSRGIHAGMEVSITVTYPDGDELRSGLRIKPSDVELFDEASKIF